MTGPISPYPPVMPPAGWPAYGIGNFNPATKIGKPTFGDLWYQSSITTGPAVGDGPPIVDPEKAEPDTNFPWGKNSLSGSLFIWNGNEWADAVLVKYPDGYTPLKLHMWETLNVPDKRTDAAKNQNTGFYWIDQWKLYTFSVDERKFVHMEGKETIDGQKTLLYHPIVPSSPCHLKLHNYWIEAF
jgi:hypothetical protein